MSRFRTFALSLAFTLPFGIPAKHRNLTTADNTERVGVKLVERVIRRVSPV